MILLFENVDYKPVLPILGKVNYECLDLRIYLLLIHFDVHRKSEKSDIGGREYVEETLIFFRVQ